MKITDKMIEDIRIIMNNTKPSEMNNINYMKEQLKQKGYEVEEKKSYLDAWYNIKKQLGVIK